MESGTIGISEFNRVEHNGPLGPRGDGVALRRGSWLERTRFTVARRTRVMPTNVSRMGSPNQKIHHADFGPGASLIVAFVLGFTPCLRWNFRVTKTPRNNMCRLHSDLSVSTVRRAIRRTHDHSDERAEPNLLFSPFG